VNNTGGLMEAGRVHDRRYDGERLHEGRAVRGAGDRGRAVVMLSRIGRHGNGAGCIVSRAAVVRVRRRRRLRRSSPDAHRTYRSLEENDDR